MVTTMGFVHYRVMNAVFHFQMSLRFFWWGRPANNTALTPFSGGCKSGREPSRAVGYLPRTGCTIVLEGNFLGKLDANQQPWRVPEGPKWALPPVSVPSGPGPLCYDKATLDQGW